MEVSWTGCPPACGVSQTLVSETPGFCRASRVGRIRERFEDERFGVSDVSGHLGRLGSGQLGLTRGGWRGTVCLRGIPGERGHCVREQLGRRAGWEISAWRLIGDGGVELAVEKAIDLITRAIVGQRCVLFLGAGIHAPPPEGSLFEYPGERRPPSGGALSRMLAAECGWSDRFPGEDPSNLQRVSLFFERSQGRENLVRAVRGCADGGGAQAAGVRVHAELGEDEDVSGSVAGGSGAVQDPWGHSGAGVDRDHG